MEEYSCTNDIPYRTNEQACLVTLASHVGWVLSIDELLVRSTAVDHGGGGSLLGDVGTSTFEKGEHA